MVARRTAADSLHGCCLLQRNLVASLFSLANHSWMEIIERAKANVEELKVLTSAPDY
jgi:hypothetical protein